MFLKLFKSNKLIISIIAVSFLFSLFYSFHFKIEPLVDARAYDVIGFNLSQGNGYRTNTNLSLVEDRAILRIGPLYEYFLAGIYSTFGHNYYPVWIIQAILHALTAFLVYLIALALSPSNKKAALWAAGLIGFSPDLIEISAMLMTETLYLFLVCLAVYAFFKYANKQNIWLVSLFGLVFGLAVLARPPFLFVLPVILFFFFKEKRIKELAIFLCFMAATFVPWTVRNYGIYHEVMPFGVAGNMNFWIGNYHGANGGQFAPPELQQFVTTELPQKVNSESINRFWNFVKLYPIEFFKITLFRINAYFSVIRPMGFWFYQEGLGKVLMVVSSVLTSVFLFVFGFAGVIKAMLEKDKKLHYLLALTVVTPLILFITVVETRYRFQIYPLLAIFAGYFLSIYHNKWWGDRNFWIAVLIIFGNGLLDLSINISKVISHLRLGT